MSASFSMETGGSTYSVFKIINGLAQVPFKGVLIEAYKGTGRKKLYEFFNDILVIQLVWIVVFP